MAVLASSISVVAAALARGSIDGVIVGSRYGLPVKLPLDRHACILGPTRSGKSSLVRYIVPKLSERYVVTVLDWHGEYGGLLTTIPANALRIRLRDIPPKLLTEVLGFGLNLNEPSIYMLYRVLRNGDYDSMRDVVRSVSDYLVSTRTEAEMKAAILRRLEYVAHNIGLGPIDVAYLFSTDLVIDMSDLTIIEEKRLMASLILSIIYMRYLRRGIVEKGVRHVLVIEEAQNLVGEQGFSIVDHIIMELGKYGVRAILVSNVVPRSTLIKHLNLVIFKSRPELMSDGIVMSPQLLSKLGELEDDEALIITNSRIVRMRPRRSRQNPTHVRVITKRIEDVHEDEEARVTDDKEEARVAEPKVTLRISDEDAKGLFKRQLDEMERRVMDIKDKVDQIERVLSADEKIIERILEIDEELKKRGR